jgi:hypothetical protein
MQQFTGYYKDKFGISSAVLQNDYSRLLLYTRDCVAEGYQFDDFSLIKGEKSLFDYSSDMSLTNYSLDLDFNVLISNKGAEYTNDVKLNFKKRSTPEPFQSVALETIIDNVKYESNVNTGVFEDALLSLNKKLPKNCYFKICFNCSFSDYFYGGSGCFGSMLCFKDISDDYLKVKTKAQAYLHCSGDISLSLFY